MPISGVGFELYIKRTGVQRRKVGGVFIERTVGDYQVYHDGVAVAGLSGMMAEQKGPSDSTASGSTYDRRIEGGVFPLWTQNGTKYKTINYSKAAGASSGFKVRPQPGIELMNTGKRSEILMHPAVAFLSSEGCIHPTSPLASAADNIRFRDSRDRVIAIIDDLAAYLGKDFPARDGRPIPRATVVIDDI